MKSLKSLFNSNLDVNISGISINSKNVKKGDLFIARKGINSDGHDYIDEAIKNGAVAAVVNKKIKCDIPIIIVNNVNDVLPDIMDWYYKDLINVFKNIIGITGTAGKTTTSFIIYKVLKDYYKTIYFGSLGILSNDYEEVLFNVPHTTYPITKLYSELNKAYFNGAKNVILETSSEGLKQNRTGNIKFDIALITNLSKAHMNAHKTMKDYIESKIRLFNNLKEDGLAILNIDDEYYNLFDKKIKNKKLTYGKDSKADIRFDNVLSNLTGICFDLYYKGNKYKIKTSLIGDYNVYNICAAISALLCLNINIEDIIVYLNNIYVNGRMNILKSNTKFPVIADIGITVDGIKNNLLYLNKLKKGRLITVIGMSNIGHDDKELNEVGKIASLYSDYVIYTTNKNRNPIFIEELVKNVSNNNYEKIPNRKEAIIKALDMANENDIVLISGSESFVISKDGKRDIVNTKEVVENYLRVR